ncbi:MAG: ribosome silencing factor [Chloroflexota bacterium]
MDALEERKAENIVLLDIQKIASFTDYFVICTATSDRMLAALADAVLEKVRQAHHHKGRLEGSPQDGWLVVDYGSIVVHLFAVDLRNYYRLEDLWNEGKVLLHVQ